MNQKLKTLLRATQFWVNSFGINPVAAANGIRSLPRFLRDLHVLRQQQRGDPQWPIYLSAPCLSDWWQQGGTARGHYFHQDLLVARRIFQRNPRKHVDVGSRVDGFVAHVATFRKIEVLDIRKTTTTVENIVFRECDVMNLPDDLANYCDSLSCLHALEHFGLGRYGDTVRYDGYQIGFRNLVKVLEAGGTLYLSVPIGPQRIDFNGHRVFSIATVLRLAEQAWISIHFRMSMMQVLCIQISL